MGTIGVRLNNREKEYLREIAEKEGLYTGENNEPSLGKALRELVKWCAINGVDMSKKRDVFDEEVRNLIEQIHVSIPNLMYLSRMNTLLVDEGIDKDIILDKKDKAIDYINKTCGAFQAANYKTLRVSINPFGLKQIPSDKDTTLWK